MSGTKAGGLQAAQTNKAKYGNSFYVHIGRRGGKASSGEGNGGFKKGSELARIAGAKGGSVSRRNRDQNKAILEKARAAKKSGPPLKSEGSTTWESTQQFNYTPELFGGQVKKKHWWNRK